MFSPTSATRVLRRRTVITLAGIGLVLTFGCSGGGGGSAASVNVKLSEFKFDPAQITVKAGQPVKISAQNTGTVAHNFIVKGIDKAASTKIAPGQTGTMEFTPATAGSFEIVCDEPGHEAGGMKGTLIVQ